MIKKHTLSYILENIIEKSLLHHIYVELYVQFINKIKESFNITEILNKELNNKYNSLINEKIVGNSYEDLCKKNNNLDKLSGLTMLIAYLEKDNNIICNTKKIISELLNEISYDNLEYVYKIITCLFNIFKINKELIKNNSDKLNEIKSNKINSKLNSRLWIFLIFKKFIIIILKMEYISDTNINDEPQDNIVNNMIQDNMFHGNTIQFNENVQFQEYNTIGPMNYTSVLPSMDNTTDNFYYLIENRAQKSKESNKAVVLKDRLLKELQELDENTIEEIEKKGPLLNEFNVVLKKFKRRLS